jgi:hypothetical protein
MKPLIAVALVLCATQAIADNYHRSYTRSDGTYVQPHYQTQSDRNPYNNYSTQGNTNPYTGQAGTRDPYQVQQQYGSQNHNAYTNPYGQQQRRNGW